MTIHEYVQQHTDCGECNCGKCFDRGETPDPTGHVADMVFFKVAAKNSPTADEFKRATKEHRGEFGDSDPLDGKEHNYMELGGWIGDQGLAMQYMGLGALLGVFNLLTPKMLGVDDGTAMQLAEVGMLNVIAK